ncbi:MAG: hypothetical protein JNJ88_08625 [Planctomycetes bacterium]|nr:hypothetical protein [Planctomycetota bacterium]
MTNLQRDASSGGACAAESSRAMPTPYDFTDTRRLGMGRGSVWVCTETDS